MPPVGVLGADSVFKGQLSISLPPNGRGVRVDRIGLSARGREPGRRPLACCHMLGGGMVESLYVAAGVDHNKGWGVARLQK